MASTCDGVVGGSATLTKVGAGTLNLLAENTFTGTVTVSAGTLALSNQNANTGTTTVGTTGQLTLNNFGTILNTSSITVGVGATLLVDNSGTLLTNRLGDSTGISLNGATLQFNANNSFGVSTTETVGTITLGSGQSTINAGFAAAAVPGASSVLTSVGLSRTAGATVNFIGGGSTAATLTVTPLGTSTNQLIFGNLATSHGSVGQFNSNLQYQGNQGNILPYAEVDGAANNGDFATYTASGIAPFTNYAIVNVNGNTTNLNEVGNTTLNANPNDIVKVVATGTLAYNVAAVSNLSIGRSALRQLAPRPGSPSRSACRTR